MAIIDAKYFKYSKTKLDKEKFNRAPKTSKTNIGILADYFLVLSID